jgi:hypothetical protein
VPAQKGPPKPRFLSRRAHQLASARKKPGFEEEAGLRLGACRGRRRRGTTRLLLRRRVFGSMASAPGGGPRPRYQRLPRQSRACAAVRRLNRERAAAARVAAHKKTRLRRRSRVFGSMASARRRPSAQVSKPPSPVTRLCRRSPAEPRARGRRSRRCAQKTVDAPQMVRGRAADLDGTEPPSDPNPGYRPRRRRPSHASYPDARTNWRALGACPSIRP